MTESIELSNGLSQLCYSMTESIVFWITTKASWLLVTRKPLNCYSVVWNFQFVLNVLVLYWSSIRHCVVGSTVRYFTETRITYKSIYRRLKHQSYNHKCVADLELSSPKAFKATQHIFGIMEVIPQSVCLK